MGRVRVDRGFARLGRGGGTSRHGARRNTDRQPGHGQPRRETLISARYAVKWANLNADGLRSRTLTQLLMGRLTQDLDARWDVGMQAGIAFSQGGGRRSVLGGEVGYQLMPNLWMSAGYNALGLKDPDLGGSNFTSQGPYVRMRFKFDENTVSPRSAYQVKAHEGVN